MRSQTLLLLLLTLLTATLTWATPEAGLLQEIARPFTKPGSDVSSPIYPQNQSPNLQLSNPTNTLHSGANPPAPNSTQTSSAQSKCTAARATETAASWSPAPPPIPPKESETRLSVSTGGVTLLNGCLGIFASSSFIASAFRGMDGARVRGFMGGMGARSGGLRIRGRGW